MMLKNFYCNTKSVYYWDFQLLKGICCIDYNYREYLCLIYSRICYIKIVTYIGQKDLLNIF